MDETVFILLWSIILYFNLGWSQEIDMNITLETNLKSVISAIGESHRLICSAKGDRNFFLSNPIIWTHESTDGKRTVISRYMAETDTSDRYHVYDSSSDFLGRLQLNITDVKEIDDGKFICTIKNKRTNNKLDEVQIDFVVVRPLRSMTVEINSEQYQTVKYFNDTNNNFSLTLPEGNYKLACVVNGSNPEPEVKLNLNDKELTSDINIIQNNDTESITRTYYAKTVSSTYLSESDSGCCIQCEVNLPGASQFSWIISYNITIISNDATSKCNPYSLISQLLLIVLTCMLLHF